MALDVTGSVDGGNGSYMMVSLGRYWLVLGGIGFSLGRYWLVLVGTGSVEGGARSV